jgi:hypothetical protein
MSKILGMKKSQVSQVRNAVYQQVNTNTVITSNVLRLFTSSNPESIQKSACICMLLNDSEVHTKSILANISTLQSLFKQTFFVFVLHGENKIIELTFNKINSSVFIQSPEPEEYKQRNIYLKFVNENRKIFDLMLVIDPLISLITPLNPKSFEFLKSDLTFSACFSNQSYKYYDIESLVSDTISVCTIADPEEKKTAIKSFQKHIHKASGNIPVRSAFGGFGIYDVKYIEPDNKYTTDNHITFNLKIYNKNSEMFIISSFVIETSPENCRLYI